MGGIGHWEILLIFLVILLVFGAKRIPEIARGLGKGIREFKDATTNIKSELSSDDDRRINSPRQGSTTPRQDAYQQQAPSQQYQQQQYQQPYGQPPQQPYGQPSPQSPYQPPPAEQPAPPPPGDQQKTHTPE